MAPAALAAGLRLCHSSRLRDSGRSGVSDNQQVAAVLARQKSPLFLARSVTGARKPTLSLHTSDGTAPRDMARRVAADLAMAGVDVDCRVVGTKPAKLSRKSLEAMAKVFGSGEIVYDPTGLVTRTESVLSLARRIRTEAKATLRGIFLDPDRRTLFVILDRKAFPAETKELLAKRVEAMAEIAGSVQAWRAADAPGFELAIRIGFELPVSVQAIPVDRKSVPSPMGTWQRRGIAAAIGSLLGFGALTSAQAADIVRPPVVPAPIVVVRQQPAVARPNFDLLFAGVFLNGDGYDNFRLGAVGLKGAVPLGQSFGLQVDAAVGTDNYWGVGGHLFWRDPSHAMLGVIGSHESLGGATFDRWGGEAELYLRNVTLRGEVSQQSGDAPHTLFGGLDVIFYAHPNFSLTGGAHRENADWRGHVGLEWQPQGLSGLSLFADGDFGGNNFSKVVAGVNFHFHTPGVTLIDRDRKYDPVFSLFHFAPKPAGYSLPSIKP
jgi:hypothetical protein